MLGRLLKNEFKCTYKKMLVIYAMAVVVTVFGCLLYSIDSLQKGKMGEVLETVFVMTYVLAVVMLVFLTYVSMCERFYKSMYADQGYLTHTLPVKPLSNLNVRLIVSVVWLFLSGILLVISLFSVAVADGLPIEELASVRYVDLDQAAREIFGYGFVVTVLVFLLFALVVCLDLLLLVFSALSLGQLVNQHKIGAAVGWGVGFYMIQQISFVAVLSGYYEAYVMPLYDKLFSSAYWGNFEFEQMLTKQSRNMMWIAIGLFAAFALAEYVVSAVIVRKHVNLE